jgi:dephospho-CoA kinase
MLRAALTGGIATGKSYCLGRFAAHGVPTIDADLLARDAVAPGTAGLRAVVDRFGAGMLTPDGALDRPALGRIIFRDARARAALEAIIHPEVYRGIRAWFAALPPATRLAVADIPLLFETGQEHEFDDVIVTACEPDEQLRRMMARDHLPEADARARLAAQLPIDEKIKRATHVIRTDRGFADTDAQVRDVYTALLAAS